VPCRDANLARLVREIRPGHWLSDVGIVHRIRLHQPEARKTDQHTEPGVAFQEVKLRLWRLTQPTFDQDGRHLPRVAEGHSMARAVLLKRPLG
jgi:hypothetical protein